MHDIFDQWRGFIEEPLLATQMTWVGPRGSLLDNMGDSLTNYRKAFYDMYPCVENSIDRAVSSITTHLKT